MVVQWFGCMPRELLSCSTALPPCLMLRIQLHPHAVSPTRTCLPVQSWCELLLWLEKRPTARCISSQVG